MSDIIAQQAEEYTDNLMAECDEDYITDDTLYDMGLKAFKAGARRKITSAEIEAAAKAMYYADYVRPTEEYWIVEPKEIRDKYIKLAKVVIRSIGHTIEGDE